MVIHEIRFRAAKLLGRLFATSRVRSRYGFSLRGNVRDMVTRYIYAYGMWEPCLTAFLTDRLGPQTQFYDLGTNVGYFSLLAASRGAKVTGIEASPEMARLAQYNLSQAGFAGEIINAAVAPKEGELLLYENFGATNTGSRTTIPIDGDVHAKVRGAPLLRLVELDETADIICKIDIEGAEIPVLEELLDWLGKHPASRMTIIAEIQPCNSCIVPKFIDAGCVVSYLRNDYSRKAYVDFDGTYELVPNGAERPPEPYETVIESPAWCAGPTTTSPAAQ